MTKQFHGPPMTLRNCYEEAGDRLLKLEEASSSCISEE
jgi:hypothetical protein